MPVAVVFRAPPFSLCAVAVAALVGCAAVQAWPALPSLPILAAVLAVAVVAACIKRWPWLRLPAVAMAFAAWAALHATQRMAHRLPFGLEGRDIVVTGRIVDLPRRRGADASFLFQPLPHAGEPDVDGLVRLTWYRAPRMPEACESWRFALRLRRPRGAVNPGGFDAERNALQRDIVATGYVRSSPTNTRLAAGHCVDGWRDAIGQRLDAELGPEGSRVLKALATGDTRGLDAADWDIARATGTSHLIAISGFHVGVAAGGGVLAVRVLYFLIPWLATRLPLRIGQGMAGLGVAFAYGMLAGMGLPTVRTLLMVAVLVVAAASRRRIGGLALLALALIAVLVVDPLAVLSAGFWLSFAGVAFLMACVAPAGKGWRARVAAMLRTQAVMSVALLPLSFWCFGSASLWSFPANLVAAPVVSFAVIPLTLLGCAALPLQGLSGPMLRTAAAVVESLWRALAPLADAPGAHASVPEAGLVPVMLATASAAWAFAPRGLPLRGFALLGFLPLVFPPRDDPPEGAFRAWVLDVGQGLAVLVRTRSHTLVYDAGPGYAGGGDAGAGTVLPALGALGIAPASLLVVSHGDADHAGGAASVHRRFPAAEVFAGEPARLRVDAKACARAPPWAWDGVRFRFLAVPLPTGGKASANDHSCVLAVEGHAGRLLLTGDVSARAEARMDPATLRSSIPTVTTIAHHGSRHSSSLPWLRAVRPRIAVASTGWRNRFGHPHPLVVDRHADLGVAVYDTARSGALRIDVPASGEPHVVREWRRPANRYWRE